MTETVKSLGSARHPPPYFAGRKVELASLHGSLEHLLATGDPTGGIVLVTGVPGAGKTQLGRKFADEALARHDRVARFHMGTSLLENHTDLVLELGAGVGAYTAARKAAEMETRRTGGGIGLGKLFQKSHTREHHRHTGSFDALLAATRRTGMWKRCRALVLVIDELQTVTPAGMRALRVLHEGNHGCPILVVGIGLQHTRDVLANPAHGSDAISRLAEPIPLGCLTPDEAQRAIARGLQQLGHLVPEESAQALADASYGFPLHIHGYLAGAQAAIRKHGNLEPGAALDEALRSGDRARTDYYDSTLDKLRPDREVVLPVIERMRACNRSTLRRSEAVAAVSASGRDGEAVVAQAVAHGVLALEKGKLGFAIPSFHTHMLQQLQLIERARPRT